jgi:catechol 2,3-dioxygenase-like lactoylglutathione lyase family enzyme
MKLRNASVMAILPAEDIERAKRFYSEKLGLRSAEFPLVGGDAAFEGADGTLLYVYTYEGGAEAANTAAGWAVDDVEETVEELRRKGIVFERYDTPSLKTDERGIAEMNGTKAAWFKDTEGNTLAITMIPQ